jgi:type IV pilus assembly protein PilC
MPVLTLAEPTRAVEGSKRPGSTPPQRRTAPSWRRVPGRVLEQFTRNLQTQLEAGVPLVRALEVEANQGGHATMTKTVRSVLDELTAGAAFGEALDLHPRVFAPVYRNLVKAGEQSGRLERMLGDLADFMAWREDVRATIRKASIYPSIVIAATFGVILFILGFVFPKFEALFARLGDDLPRATRWLMAVGVFVRECWPAIVATAVGTIGATAVAARTRSGADFLFGLLARAPLFDHVLDCLDMARLTRNLAILTGAGIPLVRSLELGSEVVNSPMTKRRVQEMCAELVIGTSFVQAAAATKTFPPMALNLISVGDESGRMPDVLGRLAEHYNRAAKDAVTRALSVMEPAITLFLGAFVGGLAVTIITTLYKTMMVMGK